MKNQSFEKLLDETRADKDVVGLILVGSRGKGFENEYSDYDVVMVGKDGRINTVRRKYNKNLDNIDLTIFSFSDFKKYAGFETPEAWDRYSFAHVRILLDRTKGKLKKIIHEKGHIPAKKIRKFIEWWIDGYVNGVFRSVKCIRNGNSFGAHIEAVNSILDLLTLIFAMNGRHRPFLGYVEKELKMYPLKHLPWSPAVFVKKIHKVLESADLATQQELLIGIEKMSRKMGYGKVLDGWQGKDKWAMNFRP